MTARLFIRSETTETFLSTILSFRLFRFLHLFAFLFPLPFVFFSGHGTTALGAPGNGGLSSHVALRLLSTFPGGVDSTATLAPVSFRQRRDGCEKATATAITAAKLGRRRLLFTDGQDCVFFLLRRNRIWSLGRRGGLHRAFSFPSTLLLVHLFFALRPVQ